MERRETISTIIITVFAIIVIFGLAFLYYYFASRQDPGANFVPVVLENQPVNNIEKEVDSQTKTDSFSTEVINFIVPEVLPTEIKDGDCQINSLAYPYREDAWRCTVGKIVYDPCFSTLLSDVVYCKTNPLKEGEDFLIKLVKPLPLPVVPQNLKSNWAWFLELDDGESTFCGPYTANRPMADGQVAFYGCKINENKELEVLIGDIKNNNSLWTAEKAVFVKNGSAWLIKSTAQVNIKRLWQ